MRCTKVAENALTGQMNTLNLLMTSHELEDANDLGVLHR